MENVLVVDMDSDPLPLENPGITGMDRLIYSGSMHMIKVSDFN